MRTRHQIAGILIPSILIVVFGIGCLFNGSVPISPERIIAILSGNVADTEVDSVIILQSRLPMVITAALAGAALSVAGLLLQTTFNNPLAGPSILGISTGSSLGVALIMLWISNSSLLSKSMEAVGLIGGATIGAAMVIILLLVFSSLIKNSVMLLIAGIMIGYLASSAISLLNFFATQEGVHSFVIWGLGSFGGVTPARLPIFTTVTLILLTGAFLMIKPLNALLLGDAYAENLGVNLKIVRNWLLLISGGLTAIVTAYCGPIGFLGLAVPHIARLAVRTSNHLVLLPSVALYGAATSLLCTLISTLPSTGGVIPINAITPIISFPIILYVILNRNRILYFS